jgi:diaminopimelate epimerase
MTIPFYKYQGTGNDFILIDDREGAFSALTQPQIAQLCDRRFGIGADGLILLQVQEGYDFKMKYFNADGNESTMCGNGGRCIVRFAFDLKIIENTTLFIAIDGPHDAQVEGNIIKLKMKDVNDVRHIDDYFILNTGSPHYVTLVNDADAVNVFFEGKKVRNSPAFKSEGINVNFVEQQENGIKVRTYERGVENETYSCGTGVVASAIVNSLNKSLEGNHLISVTTLGGNLSVALNKHDNRFSDVWLNGPAAFVFKGEVVIQ